MLKKQYLAEIFYHQNHFASFDFGDFAVVIYRDKNGQEKISSYCREYYAAEFLRFWGPRIVTDPERVKVPSNVFYKLRRLCEQDSHKIDKLRSVIENNFQKYIKAYSS